MKKIITMFLLLCTGSGWCIDPYVGHRFYRYANRHPTKTLIKVLYEDEVQVLKKIKFLFKFKIYKSSALETSIGEVSEKGVFINNKKICSRIENYLYDKEFFRNANRKLYEDRDSLYGGAGCLGFSFYSSTAKKTGDAIQYFFLADEWGDDYIKILSSEGHVYIRTKDLPGVNDNHYLPTYEHLKESVSDFEKLDLKIKELCKVISSTEPDALLSYLRKEKTKHSLLKNNIIQKGKKINKIFKEELLRVCDYKTAWIMGEYDEKYAQLITLTDYFSHRSTRGKGGRFSFRLRKKEWKLVSLYYPIDAPHSIIVNKNGSFRDLSQEELERSKVQKNPFLRDCNSKQDCAEKGVTKKYYPLPK